jgi:hypothetical protein
MVNPTLSYSLWMKQETVASFAKVHLSHSYPCAPEVHRDYMHHALLYRGLGGADEARHDLAVG